MKYLLPIIVAICCPMVVFCQDITGLWKGTMLNESFNQSYDYEVVITKDKGKYTAFSHTWFLIDGKRYYGVKKLNVRVAKDGKIVMQDASLVDNNYPVPAYKKVIQLNVLNLTNADSDPVMEGEFVTNRSKDYKEITGRINIKKVSQLSAQSDLMEYLQKNSSNINVTVVK